jgi:hypothetical protein
VELVHDPHLLGQGDTLNQIMHMTVDQSIMPYPLTHLCSIPTRKLLPSLAIYIYFASDIFLFQKFSFQFVLQAHVIHFAF